MEQDEDPFIISLVVWVIFNEIQEIRISLLERASLLTTVVDQDLFHFEIKGFLHKISSSTAIWKAGRTTPRMLWMELYPFPLDCNLINHNLASDIFTFQWPSGQSVLSSGH